MKKLKVFLVNLAVLVGLLLLLEMLVRHFFPFHVADATDIYEYNDTTGYDLVPNLHFTKSSDYFQEYYSSTQGTANVQNEINIDTLPVVFTVGDSFTYGIGSGIDESYPFLLDLELNLDTSFRFQPSYKVVNLGVSGYGGKQNLLRLKEYAQKYHKPVYVLYFGCDNDYEDDLLFSSGYKHKHIVKNSPYWGGYYKPVKWLFQDSHLGRYIKNTVGIIRRGNVTDKKEDVSNDSVAKLEEDILDAIKNYCKENDITLMVSWTAEGKEASYQWLKKWAKQHQIYFVDWLPKIQAIHQSSSKLTVNNPHSGGHYRTWVNLMIAKSYAKEIKKIDNQLSKDVEN